MGHGKEQLDCSKQGGNRKVSIYNTDETSERHQCAQSDITDSEDNLHLP